MSEPLTRHEAIDALFDVMGSDVVVEAAVGDILDRYVARAEPGASEGLLRHTVECVAHMYRITPTATPYRDCICAASPSSNTRRGLDRDALYRRIHAIPMLAHYGKGEQCFPITDAVLATLAAESSEQGPEPS